MVDHTSHIGCFPQTSIQPEGNPNQTSLMQTTLSDPGDIGELFGPKAQTSFTASGGEAGIFQQLMSVINQLMSIISALFGKLDSQENDTTPPSSSNQGGNQGGNQTGNTGTALHTAGNSAITNTTVNTGNFSTAPQTGPYTPAQAKATGERMITHLMKDLGITRAQAAGIVGNIQAESDLNPGINQGGIFGPPGSGGAGFGWVQWSGSRRDEYVQFARQQGLDPRSEAANYAFLVHELKGPYKGVLDRVRSAGSAAQSAEIMFSQYEMPNDDSLGRRIGFAQQWA